MGRPVHSATPACRLVSLVSSQRSSVGVCLRACARVRACVVNGLDVDYILSLICLRVGPTLVCLHRTEAPPVLFHRVFQFVASAAS